MYYVLLFLQSICQKSGKSREHSYSMVYTCICMLQAEKNNLFNACTNNNNSLCTQGSLLKAIRPDQVMLVSEAVEALWLSG